jgi:hypothetical protein
MILNLSHNLMIYILYYTCVARTHLLVGKKGGLLVWTVHIGPSGVDPMIYETIHRSAQTFCSIPSSWNMSRARHWQYVSVAPCRRSISSLWCSRLPISSITSHRTALVHRAVTLPHHGRPSLMVACFVWKMKFMFWYQLGQLKNLKDALF